MALETLSYHKDIKITQAQTNVSYFYLNPLLQVEFRVIFEAFSYILLDGSKPNAIFFTYRNHQYRPGCLCSKYKPQYFCKIAKFKYREICEAQNREINVLGKYHVTRQ